MRLRAATHLAIALAIPLALGSLAACGGDESASAGEGTAKSAARPPAPKQAGARCRAQAGDLVDALDRLRHKLVAGLDYDDYLDEVRAARRRYRDLPVDRLALGCLLGVAAPTERALNRYIEAVNIWGDCVAVPSCRAESIEAELQRVWRRAGDSLLAAREKLREGQPAARGDAS